MEQAGNFSPLDFADELAAAADNRQLGTRVWFENDHIQVWEVRLEPGERGAFHIHDQTYFWTVTEPGRGLQRFVDGQKHTRFQRAKRTTAADCQCDRGHRDVVGGLP